MRQIGPPALSQCDAGQSRLLECLLRQSLSIARDGGRAGARDPPGFPFSQRKQFAFVPAASGCRCFGIPLGSSSPTIPRPTPASARLSVVTRAPPGRGSTCLE